MYPPIGEAGSISVAGEGCLFERRPLARISGYSSVGSTERVKRVFDRHTVISRQCSPGS